jgi:hypothetical protein
VQQDGDNHEDNKDGKQKHGNRADGTVAPCAQNYDGSKKQQCV